MNRVGELALGTENVEPAMHLLTLVEYVFFNRRNSFIQESLSVVILDISRNITNHSNCEHGPPREYLPGGIALRFS